MPNVPVAGVVLLGPLRLSMPFLSERTRQASNKSSGGTATRAAWHRTPRILLSTTMSVVVFALGRLRSMFSHGISNHPTVPRHDLSVLFRLTNRPAPRALKNGSKNRFVFHEDETRHTAAHDCIRKGQLG